MFLPYREHGMLKIRLPPYSRVRLSVSSHHHSAIWWGAGCLTVWYCMSKLTKTDNHKTDIELHMSIIMTVCIKVFVRVIINQSTVNIFLKQEVITKRINTISNWSLNTIYNDGSLQPTQVDRRFLICYDNDPGNSASGSIYMPSRCIFNPWNHRPIKWMTDLIDWLIGV